MNYPYKTNRTGLGDVICFDNPIKVYHTIWEAGEYVVIKTTFDGGDDDPKDPWPNGHHVWIRKLQSGLYSDLEPEFEFYQSGSFNNVIEEVTVIRKMKQTFV